MCAVRSGDFRRIKAKSGPFRNKNLPKYRLLAGVTVRVAVEIGSFAHIGANLSPSFTVELQRRCETVS